MSYESKRICENKDTKSMLYHSRMGKRLTYVLRYGAEKEGLNVYEGGYVNIMDLLRVPLLENYRPNQLLEMVRNSLSHRGVRRYEHKQECGDIYVRAAHGRRMERNPCHMGTNVPRLLELTMKNVCDNINQFDFEGFPDEFLLNAMIHKLKRTKKLNNQALRTLLCSTIEHLDLEGVYLTESSIKVVGNQCPHLKVLSLKYCGYVMTDHFMEILLKKLPELESLNLAGCRHLTDRTLKAIIKRIPSIQHINLGYITNLTEAGILNLAISCTNLEHIDVFDNPNLSNLGQETLLEIANERGIHVILGNKGCIEKVENKDKEQTVNKCPLTI